MNFWNAFLLIRAALWVRLSPPLPQHLSHPDTFRPARERPQRHSTYVTANMLSNFSFMGKQNKPLIRQATKSLADTAENKGLYCFSLQFLHIPLFQMQLLLNFAVSKSNICFAFFLQTPQGFDLSVIIHPPTYFIQYVTMGNFAPEVSSSHVSALFQGCPCK